MRFLQKLLVSPLLLSIGIIVGLGSFLLQTSVTILALGSLLFGLLGVLVLVLDSTVNGLFILAAAFLISPYGLPMLAARLLGGIEVLRYAIRERL